MIVGALRTLKSRWRTLLTVHLLFTLLGITLLTPVFTISLRALVTLSGSAAVADQDIALLLLSPMGMVVAIALIAILLALSGLELAALQLVAHAASRQLHIGAADACLWAFKRFSQVLRLTLQVTLRVLAYLVPYAGILALIALVFLRDYDINYYLAQKPPSFLLAVTLAAGTTFLLVWFLGRRLLGWCLVFPLVLFRKSRPAKAFSESESLTSVRRGQCAMAFAAWLAIAAGLTALPAIFVQLATIGIVGSGQASLLHTVALLTVIVGIWAGLSFLVGAWNFGLFASVIERLYQTVGGNNESGEELPLVPRHHLRRRPLLIGFAALALAAVALTAGFHALVGIRVPDRAVIIAHRGAAGAAPENTLAAVRKAIADGAHWVEIDVQESRDGHVVVVHDSDFMKLAGNPLKVWDGELEEIRRIDVGSWFGAQFSGERVPTLQEVLEAVRGKSGLVIELKYYGHDESLEQRVIDIVEARGMAADVKVMSLSLPGVEKTAQLRPDWQVGLLAATAVGDLTRLDVDFLAVNQNIATSTFIRRAQSRGKRVYVWTVNDGFTMSRLISMGVDGLITDEPALARNVLKQRSELSSAERLLLGLTTLLDRPDIAKRYRDNSP